MVFLSFMEAKANNLFVYRSGDNNMYLLLDINNIIITTHPELLQCTTTTLQLEFAIKDLGPLHNFMGILVEQQTRQPDLAAVSVRS
jgi:predicted ferric reductase